ncbi:Hypothetical protein A7982_07095 [Minicystis rosea]|nr:Hypothetical protein A7982_07095 [Minicystis rosea]
MKRAFLSLVALAAVSLAPAIASAHISIASGPGFAGSSQEISFGVGHGCSGLDTYSVKIEIPSDVTSVRAMTSDFGAVSFEKDAANIIKSVTWQKPDASLLEEDLGYYKLVLRIKVPNKPFTLLHFPAHQTCRSKDGQTTTTVDWIAVEETDGGAEPAPALKILPTRNPGWNKVTVPAAITDLSVFFSDALIVWKEDAAYSANPNTVDQISKTAGVKALGALAANDEIWVKY